PFSTSHPPRGRGARGGQSRSLSSLPWLAEAVDRGPFRPLRRPGGHGAGRSGPNNGHHASRGRGGLLRQQHGRHVRERALLRRFSARSAAGAALRAGGAAGERARRRRGPPARGHRAGGDLLLGLRLRSSGAGRGARGGALRVGGRGDRGRLRLPVPAHVRRVQRPALGGRGALPAVPGGPRRDVVRRGRGRPGAGAAGAGAGARRRAAGGARRRRLVLRCPPHDRAGPDRRRGGGGRRGGAGGRRPGRRGGGFRQRPRHGHAAQRRRRVAGSAAGLRGAGRGGAAGGHQGAARASARLLGRHRGGGDGALPAARRAAPGAAGGRGGPGAAGLAGARRAPFPARHAGGGLHQPRLRRVQCRARVLALGGTGRLSAPVLVTGVGTLGCWGSGSELLAAALAAGVPLASEVDRSAGYHLANGARRACLVPAGQLAGWLSPGESRRMSPPSKLAVAASRMALECAGLDGGEEERTAVVIATAFGPSTNTEILLKQILFEGPESASPSLFMESVANAPAAQIAIALKARGSSLTVCQREAGPLLALGTGAAEIDAGRARRVLAGTVDEMTPLLHALLDRFGALARGGPEGEELARPFGRGRNGFLAGEGATVLVLESAESVADRGGKALARVLAWGSAFDPTAPPSGWGQGHHALARGLRRTLERAGLRPADVDLVVSGASGAREGDRL